RMNLVFLTFHLFVRLTIFKTHMYINLRTRVDGVGTEFESKFSNLVHASVLDSLHQLVFSSSTHVFGHRRFIFLLFTKITLLSLFLLKLSVKKNFGTGGTCTCREKKIS
ncbi:hypothetical protein ACJX0J_020535, partial [Zea mays]